MSSTMTHFQASAIFIGILGLLLGGSTFFSFLRRNGDASSVVRDRANAAICMVGALAMYVWPQEATFLALFIGWVGANALMFWVHIKRARRSAEGLQ